MSQADPDPAEPKAELTHPFEGYPSPQQPPYSPYYQYQYPQQQYYQQQQQYPPPLPQQPRYPSQQSPKESLFPPLAQPNPDPEPQQQNQGQGQPQDQYQYQQQPPQYPYYQHSYQSPPINPHFATPRPANDMSSMLTMMMMGNNRNSGGSSGILQMMLGLGMINPLMFLAMSAGDGLGDDDDMQKYLDKQWKKGKRKLSIDVDYGMLPMEYSFMNTFHGFPDPTGGDFMSQDKLMQMFTNPTSQPYSSGGYFPNMSW